MYFTKDDFKKIQEWLSRYSIKDSELPTTNAFKGGEYLTIVLNNSNVKVSLSDFVEYIILLGISDIINISSRYNIKYISLIEAINLIPVESRKCGQIITFLDREGNWQLHQFVGQNLTQWLNQYFWKDIVSDITEDINPDDEDLTIIENDLGNRVLRLKDKPYDERSFSGLGRTYLRKNMTIVENPETNIGYYTNLLTQSMVSRENTIYIILYNYDLNGLTIIIPNNSILQFEGGSINNGEILLNNTKIMPMGNLLSDYITAKIDGTFAKGLYLFDGEDNKLVWWTGADWVDANGNILN